VIAGVLKARDNTKQWETRVPRPPYDRHSK